MRALALTLLMVPSMAWAQQPLPPAEDPGECTTTTTVRCTGAAAPYAVMPPQAPAPVVVAPPPPAVAPAPAQQIIILDPRKLTGDGWKVTQDANGAWWHERKTSTDAPAVWGTGLAFWLGGYAIAAIAGMQQGGIDMFGWWPIIGAMMNAGFAEDTSAKALWAVDGLAQAGGFVMFLVGLAAGPDKIERQPIQIGATAFVGGGSGVALSGRF
jgi:hypothetical protein